MTADIVNADVEDNEDAIVNIERRLAARDETEENVECLTDAGHLEIVINAAAKWFQVGY